MELKLVLEVDIWYGYVLCFAKLCHRVTQKIHKVLQRNISKIYPNDIFRGVDGKVLSLI